MPTIFRKRLILSSYARLTIFKEEIQKLKEMLKVESYQWIRVKEETSVHLTLDSVAGW